MELKYKQSTLLYIFVSTLAVLDITSGIKSNKTLSLKKFYQEIVQSAKANCNFYLDHGYMVRISDPSCQNLPEGLNRNWQIAKLVIVDTKIEVLKENSFNNIQHIQELIIDKNTLKTVHNRTFSGLTNVRVLSLSYNAFTHLPSGTFEGLTSLTRLVIRKSLITSVRYLSSALRSLANLKSLDMKYTELKTITEDDLEPVSGLPLEEMSMDSCYLTFIQPEIFQHLPKLKSLNIKNNLLLSPANIMEIIKALNGSMLESLDMSKLSFASFPTEVLSLLSEYPRLSTLYLLKYKSSVMTKGMFPPMPHIRHLFLDRNKVRNIQPGTFKNVSNLVSLSMYNSFFAEVPNAIEDLTKLEKLNLTGKGKYLNYMDVTTFNFSSNPVLKDLDLSRNKIPTIDSNSFIGASSLERLTLTSCNISIILQEAFGHLTSLAYLDLTHNPLNVVEMRSGKIMPDAIRLQYLSLSRTGIWKHIKNSRSGPFSHLKALEILDLSYIKMTHIQSYMFQGLEVLEKLVLKHNLIKHWNGPFLSALASNVAVDLSRNLITGAESSFIDDINALPANSSMDLSNNPFLCTCKSADFLKWIQQTSANITDLKSYLSYRKYTCVDSDVSLLKPDVSCLLDISSSINVAILSVFIVIFIICMLLLGFLVSVKMWPQGPLSNAWQTLLVRSKNSDNYDYQFDAFISYSSSDHEWINHKLLPALENDIDSKHLCIYERDFTPGREIASCIFEGIKKSRKVIMVVSNNFIKSQWCIWEMHLAQCSLIESKRDDIVVIMLEELDQSTLPPLLQYIMKTRIYLAWETSAARQELFWSKLKSLISGVSNPSHKSILRSEG